MAGLCVQGGASEYINVQNLHLPLWKEIEREH